MESVEPIYVMSPPVRGRGLKPGTQRLVHPVIRVAPRAGAWIETYSPAHCEAVFEVAPRAGAWIETCYE